MVSAASAHRPAPAQQIVCLAAEKRNNTRDRTSSYTHIRICWDRHERSGAGGPGPGECIRKCAANTFARANVFAWYGDHIRPGDCIREYASEHLRPGPPYIRTFPKYTRTFPVHEYMGNMQDPARAIASARAGDAFASEHIRQRKYSPAKIFTSENIHQRIHHPPAPGTPARAGSGRAPRRGALPAETARDAGVWLRG